MSDVLMTLERALRQFVAASQTQNQEHIRPLHAHIVQRLVVEGGFRPQDVLPSPPLRVETSGTGAQTQHLLHYDAQAMREGDQTILGGLKTKNVDVVVSNRQVGPCLAVSVKGTLNAFRNLTNRMEEAAGDCTNLHICYPALVYGFLHVLRANLEADTTNPNDVAITRQGGVVDTIVRYHDAMARIAGRKDIRNDVSRYEAVALALVERNEPEIGRLRTDFPRANSLLKFDQFFDALYRDFDLRFVYAAPALAKYTRRLAWSAESPIIPQAVAAGFRPRIAS